MGGYHVAVLLGSRWAALEDQATRWREVVVRWVGGPRDVTVTLVDWPSWSARSALPGAGTLVELVPSWLGGVRLLATQVPLPLRPTPLDALGWSRVGRGLRAALGDQPLDLVVSAHPLWNPVLPRLGAARTGFDAVDDWRGHPLARRAGARIDLGYRAAAASTVVTANSSRLAERLRADYDVEATVVPNGVDLGAFACPTELARELPHGPFAVYVGVVQERVDIELLCAVSTRAGVPVVVAGPASPAAVAVLERAGATMLGAVPHREVPGLLRRAAVGLVPHHVNELTVSMDPMKVLEYLAAGLPVVSTPLPGMSELSPRIAAATSTDGFVAAVRDAIDVARLPGHDPAVADRDWDVVADRLFALHAGESA